MAGFLFGETIMRNLISALGSNVSSYESIALKIVDLVDTAEVSSEIGVIALKTAQLILDARQRDSWDLAWSNCEKVSLNLT
jgi:hypothetical protein